MEFGSGHDVRPGDDITLETSAGSQDLGQATYDSDSDGVADSVIIIQDDHEYLITDSDSDGYADSVRAFDASGHEIDPVSGHVVDTSGSSGDAGRGSNVVGGDGDGYGPLGGTAWNGLAGTASAGLSGAGMILPGADDMDHDLGAATVDLDRDGTPDTTVVREADGAVIGYTDRDGDGVADQVTRIGAGGDVTIAVSDGRGGWEVAATGYLDGAGRLVEDQPAIDVAG